MSPGLRCKPARVGASELPPIRDTPAPIRMKTSPLCHNFATIAMQMLSQQMADTTLSAAAEI